jgi:hypothetical protein
MTGTSFGWPDLSAWPWFLWLAIIIAIFRLLPAAWRHLRQARASGWPTALGYVESAKVLEAGPGSYPRKNGSSSYGAEIGYSYSIAGTIEGGWYRRDFQSDEEAREFVRTSPGKPVLVHYNPNKPSMSELSKTAVETLLQNRAPMFDALEPAVEAYTTTDSVPAWIRPVLPLFILISVIGLVLSVWVHLGAVMGCKVVAAPFFFVLHCGIFVVWFPTVLVTRSTVHTNRKNFWKIAMANSPAWMRYMVFAFSGYALINFFLFLRAHNGKTVGDPPVFVWRGFSGHWMAFYSAALAVLYSAARARRSLGS